METASAGRDRRRTDRGHDGGAEASVSAMVFHHPDCAYFHAEKEWKSAQRRVWLFFRLSCADLKRMLRPFSLALVVFIQYGWAQEANKAPVRARLTGFADRAVEKDGKTRWLEVTAKIEVNTPGTYRL